jgi:beta-lactamase regulating signal transducer with metallopeptidase domain
MQALLAASQFIAQACIAGLWQGLALIAAVAILLRLMPRVSAAVRFAVWAFAFGLAATMPLLQLTTVSALRPHAPSAIVHLGAGWGFVIASIWAVFMLARGAQLLMHAIHLRRIWRHAQLVPLEGSVNALLQRSGRRTVEICTSTDVDSPSVIGFFSPRLLIPEWLFAKLAPSDLQQIVLHECEHLRRWDDWINLLQKVGVALFPLNPALLWVDRRLSLERELACDAGVVASTTAPFEYAHCLTRLAEHRLHRRSVALSLSAWSRQSELAQRVHHLLRPARNMSPLHARFAIALICAGLSVGALQMARVPRLFSFADNAIATPIAEAASPAPDPSIAQSLPVVYRQEAQPRATMVNAALTVHKPHRAAHKSRRGLQPRANVHTTRLNRQTRLILTSLEMRHYDSSPDAGRVAAQSIRFSPSYAAVPFGDGWLVIQL